MKRRRERITYEYECNMTGEKYVRTEKAPNPKDLMSVAAYYEMHPENDDRPAVVKKRANFAAAAAAAAVPTDETKH